MPQGIRALGGHQVQPFPWDPQKGEAPPQVSPGGPGLSPSEPVCLLPSAPPALGCGGDHGWQSLVPLAVDPRDNFAKSTRIAAQVQLYAWLVSLR